MFNKKIEDKMKNFAKIFMAFVAVMLVSCVTDTTVDSAIELGKVKTTIDLSLEGTKTHLGDKSGTRYPLLWSAGDKIAVNGIVSEPLAEDFDGKAAASFEFELEPGQELTYPRSIVYPAPAEGESGVTFPAVQTYKEGNIADGVAPLYAYAEEGEAMILKHTTAILKIGIQGSAVLDKLQVSTIKRDAIAGNFSFNAENGELKATTSSKNIIEYTFGESGLQLTEETQYVHIVVPVGLNDGLYDEIFVTLYEKDNASNIMFATVKADSKKPIVAGKVREFTNPIFYSPNAVAFVIDSAESLLAFAAEVKKGGFYKDVIFTNDVDMSNYEWKEFDWDSTHDTSKLATIHGNGYAIKGLKRPLFQKLNANIRGLHLVDLDINSNNTVQMGAFATECRSTTAVTCTFEDCSTSGKITIENPTAAPGTGTSAISYGGFIGRAYGVLMDGCVNNANIEVKRVAKDGMTTDLNSNVGGIVGYNHRVSNGPEFIMRNCVNKGTISYNDVIVQEGTAPSICVGGLIGKSFESDPQPELINNENIGSISINTVAGTMAIGGITGHATLTNDAAPTAYHVYAQGCQNRGEIKIAGGQSTKYVNLGGIVGYANYRTLKDCHNHGKLSIAEGATVNQVRLGGVVAHNSGTSSGKTDYHIDSCTNSADIEIAATCGSADAEFYIGGVVGLTQAKITGIENDNDGKIIISGTVTGNARVGGFVGHSRIANLSNVVNHTDIEISGSITGETAIGGVIGYSTTYGKTISSVTNKGDIKVLSGATISGTKHSIGGVVGYSQLENISDNVVNDGLIEIGGSIANASVTDDATSGITAVGGVVGCATDPTTTKGLKFESLTNNGAVKVIDGASITGVLLHLGGCVGDIYNITTKTDADLPSCDGLTNNGEIHVNGAIAAQPRIGGVVGMVGDTTVEASLNNITNSATGDLYLGMNYTKNANVNFGGCVGRTHGSIYNVENCGDLNISGTFTKNNYNIGCVTGYTIGAKKLVNHGNLLFTGTANIGTGNNLRLTGCAAYANDETDTLEEAINYGIISFSGETNAGLYISGVSFSSKETTNCHNKGTLSFTGKTTNNALAMSGVASKYTALSNCSNEGKIVCSGTTNSAEIVKIGGISYELTASISDSYSYCDIEAIGFEGAKIGMITASDRAEGKIATNCQVGGRIATTESEHEYTDQDTGEEKKEILPDWQEIGESNFFNFIYGSTTAWAEGSDYDGCSWLSEKPTVQ